VFFPSFAPSSALHNYRQIDNQHDSPLTHFRRPEGKSVCRNREKKSQRTVELLVLRFTISRGCALRGHDSRWPQQDRHGRQLQEQNRDGNTRTAYIDCPDEMTVRVLARRSSFNKVKQHWKGQKGTIGINSRRRNNVLTTGVVMFLRCRFCLSIYSTYVRADSLQTCQENLCNWPGLE
jgi:hypothetical protein